MNMGRLGRLAALRVVTVVGWLALLVSMAPTLDVAFELGRLGIAVGPTGSIILALRRMTLPVVEVFEAGRECGKREVSGLAEVRHLRVVDGD